MAQTRLKLNRIFEAAVLLGFGVALGYFWPHSFRSQPGLVSVQRVIDGDTIVVQTSMGQEHIRFIGVNTPEIAHQSSGKNECFGPEAAQYVKKLLSHRQVYLIKDPMVSNRDKYHRLLRYVFLPDGTLVNEKLIQEGYGFNYIYQPFQFMKDFDYFEKQAVSERKGLWGTQCPYYSRR